MSRVPPPDNLPQVQRKNSRRPRWISGSKHEGFDIIWKSKINIALVLTRLLWFIFQQVSLIVVWLLVSVEVVNQTRYLRGAWHLKVLADLSARRHLYWPIGSDGIFNPRTDEQFANRLLGLSTWARKVAQTPPLFSTWVHLVPTKIHRSGHIS